MERIKFTVFLQFLLKVNLSASLPTRKEQMQKLEEQAEELTETLKLLKKENHTDAKRQATT